MAKAKKIICKTIFLSNNLDWLISHFLKKYIEIIKKINEVIRSFAQIDVYLNAGKKNIQELKIIKFLLNFLEFDNFKTFKKIIGRITETRQKISLIICGSLTTYSANDKIMK